jgi:hypothetical protein
MASNPIVKEAQRLGWEISKGSKHYKLYRPLTGQTTILPYGFKRSTRADIRIKKQLIVGSTPRPVGT